jgi:hypothetical protein
MRLAMLAVHCVKVRKGMNMKQIKQKEWGKGRMGERENGEKGVKVISSLFLPLSFFPFLPFFLLAVADENVVCKALNYTRHRALFISKLS